MKYKGKSCFMAESIATVYQVIQIYYQICTSKFTVYNIETTAYKNIKLGHNLEIPIFSKVNGPIMSKSLLSRTVCTAIFVEFLFIISV